MLFTSVLSILCAYKKKKGGMYYRIPGMFLIPVHHIWKSHHCKRHNIPRISLTFYSNATNIKKLWSSGVERERVIEIVHFKLKTLVKQPTSKVTKGKDNLVFEKLSQDRPSPV